MASFTLLFCSSSDETDLSCHSESTSIPVNPRTGRPVGYAFVDLETADDAEKAINNLSGKEILERKVSVQVARKPEATGDVAAGTTTTEPTSGGEGRKRGTGRGRGRGRGRGGRSARGGRAVSHKYYLESSNANSSPGRW
jgi:RNA recognition motif-containing protein